MKICILSFLFNVIFVFVTGLVVTVGLVTLLAPTRMASVSLLSYWARVTMFFAKKLLNIDYRFEGLEHITIPCIVAAQHQSSWDTFIFHSIFKDPSYVVKEELNKLTIGVYIRQVKFIVVNRKSGNMLSFLRQAKEVAKTKRPIIIFPQGTRVKPLTKAPLQKGVYALYKSLGVPVIPLVLNSGHYWPRRSWIKRSGTIVAKFLPPMEEDLDSDSFMKSLEKRWAEAEKDLPKPKSC